MKRILIAGLLSATALAGTANAQDNDFYARINAGVSHGLKAGGNFPGSKLGNVGVYGFAAGYKLNENLRFDLGFDYRGSYKNNSTTNGITHSNKVKSYAAMLNVYYDIGQFNKFTPYLGAGLGVAYNQTGVTTLTGSSQGSISKGKKTNFAYKLIAGASYAVDTNVDVNLQYQYVNLGKFTTGTKLIALNGAQSACTASTGKIKAHEILLGVTYKF